MNPTIEIYTPKDKEGVKRVVLGGLKEFGFEYHKEFDSDLDDPHKYYIDGGGIFYVLKLDGDMIGTVAVIKNGKIGTLKRLYVNKSYHGNRYGSMLLDKAMEFCRNNGITEMEF